MNNLKEGSYTMKFLLRHKITLEYIKKYTMSLVGKCQYFKVPIYSK